MCVCLCGPGRRLPAFSSSFSFPFIFLCRTLSCDAQLLLQLFHFTLHLLLSLSFVCYSFGGIFFPPPLLLLPSFFVIIFGVSFLLCLWPPPPGHHSLWLLHFGGCCFFFLVAAFLLLLAFLCRSFIFVALPFLFWKWYSVARKDRLTD